jgi:putative intracellular protease/amidase
VPPVTKVAFATPDGERGRADELMLTGEGLDPWGFIPGLRRLVAFGSVLRADRAGRTAYAELERDPAFLDARPAFVVRDGNYVSARWPGDAHTFATTFARVLAATAPNDAGAHEPAR